jgi:hypothetical protein
MSCTYILSQIHPAEIHLVRHPSVSMIFQENLLCCLLRRTGSRSTTGCSTSCTSGPPHWPKAGRRRWDRQGRRRRWSSSCLTSTGCCAPVGCFGLTATCATLMNGGRRLPGSLAGMVTRSSGGQQERRPAQGARRQRCTCLWCCRSRHEVEIG